MKITPLVTKMATFDVYKLQRWFKICGVPDFIRKKGVMYLRLRDFLTSTPNSNRSLRGRGSSYIGKNDETWAQDGSESQGLVQPWEGCHGAMHITYISNRSFRDIWIADKRHYFVLYRCEYGVNFNIFHMYHLIVLWTTFGHLFTINM